MREAVERLVVVSIGTCGCSSATGVVVVADTDAAPVDVDGMGE